MSGPSEGRPPLDSQGMPSAIPPNQHQYQEFHRRPARIPPRQNSGDRPGYPGNNAVPGAFPPDDGDLDAGPARHSESQDREGRAREKRPNSANRERSGNGSRRPGGSRVCGKCGLSLTGQFVRALGDTYHLECFTCHVSCTHPPPCFRRAPVPM